MDVGTLRRRLARYLRRRRKRHRATTDTRQFTPHTDENLESYDHLRHRQFRGQL